MKATLMACLLGLAVFSKPAVAQFAVDQPKSLVGVESVAVVFGSGLLGNAELYGAVTLELRKTRNPTQTPP